MTLPWSTDESVDECLKIWRHSAKIFCSLRISGLEVNETPQRRHIRNVLQNQFSLMLSRPILFGLEVSRIADNSYCGFRPNVPLKGLGRGIIEAKDGIVSIYLIALAIPSQKCTDTRRKRYRSATQRCQRKTKKIDTERSWKQTSYRINRPELPTRAHFIQYPPLG